MASLNQLRGQDAVVIKKSLPTDSCSLSWFSLGEKDAKSSFDMKPGFKTTGRKAGGGRGQCCVSVRTNENLQQCSGQPASIKSLWVPLVLLGLRFTGLGFI